MYALTCTLTHFFALFIREKMSEYITGRVKLSSSDNTKAVSNNSKDKNKKLLFALDEAGTIVVDFVPGVYGVRAGAKVDGFLSPGSNKVNEIKWPRKIKAKKGKDITCTLEELMKENNISKKDDTLIFKTPCTYCTHTVKVDTKEYGLPQTRQRVYMFIWQPKDDDVHDDLGFYWEVRSNSLTVILPFEEQRLNLILPRISSRPS